jgi:beta-xylosidase
VETKGKVWHLPERSPHSRWEDRQRAVTRCGTASVRKVSGAKRRNCQLCRKNAGEKRGDLPQVFKDQGRPMNRKRGPVLTTY